ncbi:MAG: ABC transporter ATP-binding protein [Gammaproteobacteria bacterium]|nr:ABC transporter ATP-binding protein [Gammaproteobacteria bacterium]MXY55077.1 ABC transporter ATP-binding protein [Gammaproteobacteria bacterium]MYF27869.1 ABC transporter ATP-binding protein [Gammaproteobacteria bacterium]MYK48584.1 ABC transporter ATP-binding protein [Gammaproteobacteria bacterium]
MATLEVRRAAKHFDDGRGRRRVPAPVEFTAASGRTTALWGPSGSGKSTLLNLLAGILVPDEGTVVFQDANGDTLDVSCGSERQRVHFRRRHLGFIFQFFNLVPTLTVAENVILPLELNRLAGRSGALARLETLGLAHCADRFPETLSGGEQQRVAIARALAHEPAVVLADEPTGNLDGDNAETVTELLWRETALAQCALVIATHNQRIADRADEVIALA